MRCADRKLPWTSVRSQIARLLVAAISCAVMSSLADADDFPERSKARESTAAIRLPPRDHVPESGSSRPRGSSSSSLWTTVVSLGAIIGCLGLVGYCLKPFLGVPGGLPLEALELLGRRAIEQKVAIHLIRCGNKVLVVGVSPDGARTLSEITEPAEVQQLVMACHAPRESRSFSSFVAGTNGLMGTRQPPAQTSSLQAGEPRRA
jgi:flagellar protein FliO/FliZ